MISNENREQKLKLKGICNMKSNWIKYIFIIFIIGILIFAVLKIRQDQEESKLEDEVASTQEEQIKEIKVGIARFRYN